LVLLDVGSPVLFWQQRLGRNGRPFLVYKFRTLQAPFDRNGWPMPEHQRESGIGYLLRKTGLDEVPQLLNVLIGDMALIGPRPLLPHDQPPNPEVRLLVRPGITGWAQVNGAKSLTPTEKDRLDEWYIRNASVWTDLRVVMLTLKYVLAGERRARSELVDTGADVVAKPSPIRARDDRSRPSQRVA
jgi:lipopolysaccharide/colanic/teichoic acid biosynthesis glycosyltransferase